MAGGHRPRTRRSMRSAGRLPSATLEAQPRVSGPVLFRQLRPGALLEAFFHPRASGTSPTAQAAPSTCTSLGT